MAIAEKKDEQVEKRRALGRGVESLLPGPRVVGPGTESRVPSGERGGAGAPGQGSGGAGEKQVPHFVRNDTNLGGEGGETKVPRFARDDNSVGERDAGVLAGMASQEMEAGATLAAGQPLRLRSGQAGGAVPTLEQPEPREVISI